MLLLPRQVYLLITKLRVNEAIERLRRSHPVQLVHLRRVDVVGLRAVITNGVTDQQAATNAKKCGVANAHRHMVFLGYTHGVQSERFELARYHRSELGDVIFVAITGSCGKTTTKDLATGLLAHKLQGSSNPGSGNCGVDLIEHIIRVQPDADYCIQELGAWGPGTLDAGLELVKPDVGVVLNVRRDHYSAFHGLGYTQIEKAKVIQSLPSTGTAILNFDDPYVRRIRYLTRGSVLGFGFHAKADYRMENVSGIWPEPLSFDLTFRGKQYRVQTQLIGEHLAGSAVAAMAIAHTLGVPLEEATARIAQLPPTPRRMSAVVTRGGVCVIRDDFKAASDSLEEFLHFMQQARAPRKIAVVGRISDCPGRSRPVYAGFAKSAAKIADLLIFVGERAQSLWGGSQHKSAKLPDGLNWASGTVRVFETVREASTFLRGELRPGDLLMLKGSGASDHLERILLEHETTVRCWRAHCGLVIACDGCELLGCAAEPGDVLPAKCGEARQ